MKYLKKIGVSSTYLIGIVLFSTLLITILNYFNVISYTLVNIFELLILTTSFWYAGYKIGNNSDKKGWLEGFKFSFIYVLLFFILNSVVFNNKFHIMDIIFYIIIILSTIFGSVFGINKKLKNK
ncbi:MAG TPA: TIGR04086 family membrane protein [Tenericutes bacterium]|nr:TIGR04086 family membrane protein [Mycoplasmatota bacterium]